MSNPYVLSSLLLLAASLVGVFAYGVKRYFDDRAAARNAEQKISSELIARLDTLTSELTSHGVFLRERLGVFERALLEAIKQFAEIVTTTKESELQNKAKTAGVGMKLSRRMPQP